MNYITYYINIHFYKHKNKQSKKMAKIQLNEDYTDHITEIIPPSQPLKKGGLYLGDQTAASNLKLLQKYSITCIITIAAQLNNKYQPPIQHKQISIYDQPLQNIYEHFQQNYAYIKKNMQQGNVLVHCKMGISRSATLVIAYLMRKYKCGYQKAYGKVKDRRKIVKPNSGFVMQLKQYQGKIRECVAKGKKQK